MKIKRTVSLLLGLLMILGSFPFVFPINVFASETLPVVYWSMSGNDAYDGSTTGYAVKTLERAFAILAEKQKGGTVVIIDGINNNFSGGSIINLPDAGGTVTITSVDNDDTDYRTLVPTDPARILLYYGYIFNNDVVFDNVDFLHVTSPSINRPLYLQHHDLTVTDTCNFYKYDGKVTVGTCPAKTGDPLTSGGKLMIVSGYKTATGTSEDFTSQTIDLQGGAFGSVYVGNKKYTYSSSTPGTEIQSRQDIGNVFIRIGANASVDYGIFADGTGENTNTFINLHIAKKDTHIKFDDNVAVAEHVTVDNSASFRHIGFSVKNHENGPAVGLNEEIDVSFVDDTPVSEFGVVFKISDDSPFDNLNATDLTAARAYTKGDGGKREYNYANGESTASYRGMLVYDVESNNRHINTPITAYAYAIDENTGYTYLGEKISFTLNEVCNLIINDPDANPHDQMLAREILDTALNYRVERFEVDPIPEATARTVVYVSQSGHENGDGSSDSSTVTFEKALGMTKNIVANTVVIVVTDAIRLDPARTIDDERNDTGATSADFVYFFPANKSKIIITSYYNSVNYRKDYGASITLTSETAFYGDYTIKNTELINETDLKICMQYNNITLGTGLTCTKGTGATKYIDLVSGYHAGHSAFNTSEKVSCREDAKIEILDGTWNSFTGGNVTQNWRSVFGTVNADATLVIDIGTSTKAPAFNSTDRYYFAASGQNNVDGTVCVNVINATFSSSHPILAAQYLMKYDDMMTNYHPVINGNVILNIKGGTFSTKKITAVPTADTTNYVPNVGSNAKISINILGGTFSSTYLTVTGCGTSNSEVYCASGITATKLSISTAAQATAEPSLDYAKTEYDAPPSYDNEIEVGLFDLSEASDAELAELEADLPPSELSTTRYNTVKKYYTNENLDFTYDERLDMMKLNDENYNLTKVASVDFITMLSGEYSINKTFTNYNIGSSGGGYMIDCGDFVLVAFGDTEGEGAGKTNDPNYGGPWRANVLGFTDDTDYTDGIILDGFYLSDQGVYDGFATEFLKSAHKDGVEMSKIPTGGIMIGDTLYFSYMSVRRWTTSNAVAEKDAEDDLGIWKCNYGGLAISRDMGRTWETPSDLCWSENSDFIQLYPIMNGEWVYFFAVPPGRKGEVKLMRVSAAEVENYAAYEYFVGYDNRGKAIFEKGDEGLANSKPIIDTPAGDVTAGAGGLAIMYNEYLGEWVMLYASSNTGDHRLAGIYMRVANSLDGKWSEPVLVISQSAGFGTVYEPRICAKYQNAETGEMMLITSNWAIYNSMVFNVKLERRGNPVIDIIE